MSLPPRHNFLRSPTLYIGLQRMLGADKLRRMCLDHSQAARGRARARYRLRAGPHPGSHAARRLRGLRYGAALHRVCEQALRGPRTLLLQPFFADPCRELRAVRRHHVVRGYPSPGERRCGESDRPVVGMPGSKRSCGDPRPLFHRRAIADRPLDRRIRPRAICSRRADVPPDRLAALFSCRDPDPQQHLPNSVH